MPTVRCGKCDWSFPEGERITLVACPNCGAWNWTMYGGGGGGGINAQKIASTASEGE